MPLASGRPPVPLIVGQGAPSDVQGSLAYAKKSHASHLRASNLSTRRRGPGEPVPLSFLARLQAGLRGDTARVPDVLAHREGEDAAKEEGVSKTLSKPASRLASPAPRLSSNLVRRYRVGSSPSEQGEATPVRFSVPSKVRALFVPSCFFTIGSVDEGWVDHMRVLRHPCLVSDLQTRDVYPHGPARAILVTTGAAAPTVVRERATS